MKIVLTGKMNLTRTSETKRFKEYGIQVQKAITKGTDYLVTGSSPGWIKLDKARIYGIKELTEDEFFELLKEDYPEFIL